MILSIYIFVLGSIIGSFLNALSYRIPNSISIIKPRSRCPRCGHQLRWFENIPLISYLVQGRRCLFCKTNIPIRYFLLELSTAALFYFHLKQILFFDYIFVVELIIISIFLLIVVIDLENKIIPDSLNLLLFILIPIYTKSYVSYKVMLLGGGLAFFIPLSITYIFYKLTGKIGLGGGDIKLYGIIGISIGFQGFISNLFLSCTLGSFVVLFLLLTKIIKRNEPIPFGPFIITVLYTQLFFPKLINLIFSYIIK